MSVAVFGKLVAGSATAAARMSHKRPRARTYERAANRLAGELLQFARDEVLPEVMPNAASAPPDVRTLMSILRPMDIVVFLETSFVSVHGRTMVPLTNNTMASEGGVRTALLQLDAAFASMDMCARWGTSGCMNPVRSEVVDTWLEAYALDMEKAGYQPVAAGLYTAADAWLYVSRRDEELRAMFVDGVLISSRPGARAPSCAEQMAPVVNQKASLGLLMDCVFTSRGGEGARLLLRNIAPDPLKWASPAAVAAGVVPPNPLSLQIGPEGTKTNKRVLCGNVELTSDRYRMAEAFVARLPALLATYETMGVQLCGATPVFIRAAHGGASLTSPPLPDLWGGRQTALRRYARADDLGLGARPHSARGSAMVQDSMDKVPVEETMKRALVKNPDTVARYQRRTRIRRGGERSEGMSEFGELVELTDALVAGVAYSDMSVPVELVHEAKVVKLTDAVRDTDAVQTVIHLAEPSSQPGPSAPPEVGRWSRLLNIAADLLRQM